MCSFSLSLIIILTLCLIINQNEALPFRRSADTNADTPGVPLVDNDESKTHPIADASKNDEGPAGASAGPVEDTKKSVRKNKPRNVKGKVQKTFIRNPNYFRANKLFEKESRKEYVLEKYKSFLLPHPGFKVGDKGVTTEANNLPDTE